jgi:hypothetical protein
MKTFCVAAALALSAVHAQVTVEEVWTKVTPFEANMDENKLYTAIENAGIPKLNGTPIDNLPEKVTGSETYCVSVHRDGKLVAERYWPKNGAVGDSGPGVDTDEFTPLIIWSASKVFYHSIYVPFTSNCEQTQQDKTKGVEVNYLENGNESPLPKGF